MWVYLNLTRGLTELEKSCKALFSGEILLGDLLRTDAPSQGPNILDSGSQHVFVAAFCFAAP